MEEKDNRDKNTYFQFGELFGYFFRKKDPSRKVNTNLKIMHGINKISIIIFIAGILYLVIKMVIVK